MRRSPKRKFAAVTIAALILAWTWFVLPLVLADSCRLDIQGALAHELLQGWSPDADILLAVESGPPSQALLHRLKDLKSVVRPSRPISTDDEGMFIDPGTGKRVITCWIGQIEWVNPITVNVKASTGEGLMGEVGAVYVLRWSLSGWSLAGRVQQWVS